MSDGRALGIDLGQANDYTAVAIIDKNGDEQSAMYAVRHLERFEKGTPYPRQVERIAGLHKASQQPRGPRVDIVVDQTGVGRPVVDMLRSAGLSVNAVTITGGDAMSREGNEYRVPKRDLVSTVQVLLQSDRLKIARGLAHAGVLTEELLGFKVSVNARGHDTYGNDVGQWRETAHDDLVLAVALAAWISERSRPLQIFL